MIKTSQLFFVGALLLFVGSVFNFVSAQNVTDTITACVHKKSGNMVYKGECNSKNYYPLTWNIKGEAGENGKDGLNGTVSTSTLVDILSSLGYKPNNVETPEVIGFEIKQDADNGTSTEVIVAGTSTGVFNWNDLNFPIILNENIDSNGATSTFQW